MSVRLMAILVVTACGGGATPVIGGTCDLGASSNEIVVATSSDCGTNSCLHITSNQPDMCTSHCEIDDDCAPVPGSACTTAFTCAPVLSVGPFACQKFCVCNDRVPVTSCP